MREHLAVVAAQLHHLGADGRRVDFWWRDDDAVHPTAALDRLVKLSAETDSPLAIAAIPARAERSLADRLRGEDLVRVLVHGYAHANHAPTGAKTAEFGPHRPLSAMVDDARRGRESVRALFGAQALDVFVPPWNRLAAGLLPRLEKAGFDAVSTFGNASSDDCAVRVIDTHLDPVAWRGSRSLVDAATLDAAFSKALAVTDGGRRGPIGLLTHHLQFDEALWRFTAELLELLQGHPGVRWRTIDSLVGVGSLSWRHAIDEPMTLRPATSLECLP